MPTHDPMAGGAEAIIRALQLVVIPALLILAAGYFMKVVAGIDDARRNRSSGPVAQSLAERYKGYTAADVAAYWVAPDIESAPERERWRSAELRFLRYDLGYPLLYGVCLVWALLGARSALGLSFPAAWIFAAVAIPVVADWVENTVLLRQLRVDLDRWTPDATWISVASVATQVKWAGIVIAFGLLIVLCGRLVFR